MPNLLLELFSEEIPARMQVSAMIQLKKSVTDALVARGLIYEDAVSYVTPRRLTLGIQGLPMRSKDVTEEKKGPRIDAPEAAINGFLKSAGLTSLSEAEVVNDPKKGSFYIAKLTVKGEETGDIIKVIMPEIIKNFSWPKSMRWGATSAQPGALKWVRPLQSILCTLSNEHEETRVLTFEVGGIVASDTTQGHRFLSKDIIKVKKLEDYIPSLLKANVIVDSTERAKTISHEARTLCFAQGMELVEDDALAHEVAGLVEWPVVLMGKFDEEFLTIPPEVIRTTIRANQKCFVVNKEGSLTNRFIITSNIVARDGGAAIIAGNERVIRARLSDAKFFFETDKAKSLASRLDKFKAITYHEKIGTQAQRIERIVSLSALLAPNDAHVRQAALLCKADLVTEMVGEFPELQGLMGRYYAQIEGLPQVVCDALEEHYKPVGANDSVPTHSVSIAVALADKLDQLISFWAINEKPTGSKDPFALRRAALGVIRIILENKLRLNLKKFVQDTDLMTFFIERLKTYLKDQGLAYDLIDSVFALNEQDDLFIAVEKIKALNAFLKTDDGANLLAGDKRAANILRAEEKKGGKSDTVNAQLLTLSAEKNLFSAIETAQGETHFALKNEDFVRALSALSKLRAPLDAFFTDVMVNDEDIAIRANRLALLSSLTKLTRNIADFSKISGL